MIKRNFIACFIKYFPVALFAIFFIVKAATASDILSSWRTTYDLIMRYLNFGILVFLMLRYARKPIVSFFRGKSQAIEKEIKGIELDKKKIQDRIGELLKEREKNKVRFDALKNKIVSQGMLKKQKIIDEANKEGRLMLDNVRRKINHDITMAKRELQDEMIDSAIDLAIERLPNHITDQDNHKSVQAYLESIDLLHN